MKTAGRENPNRRATVPDRPSTWCDRSRTDPAQSSGLRSKKNCGRGRDFFLDFYFYRTYQGFSLKVDAIIPLVRSFKSAGLFDVTVLPFPPTLSQQQVQCARPMHGARLAGTSPARLARRPGLKPSSSHAVVV